MSEFDADLKQMFAQSREDLEDAAFRTDVEHKIARARKVAYVTDGFLVLMIGLAAMLGAPVLLDIVNTTTDLVDTGLTLSATPIGAWATAAATSIGALVWVRA